MSGYDHLLNKLKSEDVGTRKNAVETIIDITYFDWVRDRCERDIAFAISSLVELLNDEDSEVRILALRAIAIEFHDFDKELVFDYIPDIINVLFDENRMELKSLASHLVKDAVVEGYDIKKFIGKMTTLLENDNEDVKFGAADALTNYHAKAGNWEEIEKLLRHKDKDVNQEALGTLGHYSTASKIKVEKVIPYFLEGLENKDEEIKLVSARSIISNVHDAKVLKVARDTLITLYGSETPKIKLNAIKELSNLIKQNIQCRSKLPRKEWHIVEPILPILEKEFKTKNNEMKIFLVPVLILIYVHFQDYEKIIELMDKSEDKIMERIIYEFDACWECKIDFTPLISSLMKIFFNTKNPDVKKAIDLRIERLMGRSVKYAKLIKAAMQENKADVNKEWKTLENLKNALNFPKLRKVQDEYKKTPKKEKITKLIEYLDIDNSAIRAWASYEVYSASVFEKISIAKALPLLIKNSKDEDMIVREKATTALSYIIEKYPRKRFIPVFNERLMEESNKIVMGAASGLSQLARKGEDISEAMDNLILQINNPDKDTRYHVRCAIKDFIIDDEKAKMLLKRTEEKSLKKYEKDVSKLIKERIRYLIECGDSCAKGRYERSLQLAIDNYQACIKIDPKNVEALYKLAVVYDKQGLYEQALKTCEKLLENNPNHKKVKEIIEKLKNKQVKKN